jgi:hypothetical protein
VGRGSLGNGLHCNFPGEPQLIEEVGLGPDLRNGLPHIVNASNGVVRSFARDRTPHQHGMQSRRLASEDVPGTVIEVECLELVNLQQLNGLLHTHKCWLAHNRNGSIEFHVFPALSSLLRYSAVTVESLEAKDAFEYILYTELLQHHVGMYLVSVREDVLRLRHAL